MEIFKGVMTATSSSSPLQNHREGWVGLCNIDDSLDSIDRTGLKGDMFQPDRLNVLVGNLDWRYSGANSQSFNRNTRGTKLLEKWDLPSHSSGVHIDKIDRDTDTRDRILLNLLKGCGKTLGVVITTACRFSLE